MKTFYFLFARAAALGLLLGLPATLTHAQSSNLYDWAWVSRLGATALAGTTGSTLPASAGLPESIAADAAGNVLVAGRYAPDVIFDDPATPYQAVVTSLGPVPNGYLAKYSPSGTLLWSRNLTSDDAVLVRDVAVDGVGNAYVLGKYTQQLRIDGVVVATANTNNAYFLAKISPAGAPVWTITIERDVASASRFGVQRVAVDANGNSVVQGDFESQIVINGATYTGATNKLHCLMLRYNELGATIGTAAAYTAGAEQGRVFTDIALAANGECYLSGYIFNTATLQFGTLPALTSSNAYANGFLVKFDSTINPTWMVTSTGATGQLFYGIAIGPQGRCYAMGIFASGSIALGTQNLSVSNPQGAAGYDIFLARIAPSGTVESLVGGGGTGNAWGLAIGPQGEATIGVGGGVSWGNVQLPGAKSFASNAPTGIVQLNAAGVPQRGWQAGLPFYTHAVAVDGLNRPVLAGTAGGQAPYTFGSRQLSSPYAFNTLIARTATTALAARPAVQVAGLAVYPNPARRVVEVRTAQAGPVTVQLLDALGRSVRTQPLGAGQTQVDLGGVAPGAYTLLVQQGEARSYRRLVVAP